MAFSSIRSIHTNNVSTLQSSPLAEISGSLGDLGTLLPLMIALAVNNSISLSSTLIFSGLWNILTGIVFGIPLPVQPMKAIAAVAISRRFSIKETTSAGFVVAFAVLIFSVTGSLSLFTRTVPVPIIKGIQVGTGLSLVISAGTSLLQPLGWRTPDVVDNLIWVILAFLFLLLTQTRPLAPSALFIFLLGLLLSFLTVPASSLPSLHFWYPRIYVPKWVSINNSALSAALGQIPLTTLNSVIAVHYLSIDLLPSIPAPSVAFLGISVALMNLIGGWFGAMPVCHGSGGLAAQYRFGARSGASVILLGVIKVGFGLMFGETLVGLLSKFPRGLLGVMVMAAGLELVKVGESLNYGARDLWEVADSSPGSSGLHTSLHVEGLKRQRVLSEEERKERWTVMFVTVSTLLAFRNDGIGFVAGTLCHFVYKGPSLSSLWQKLMARWSTRSRNNEQTRVEEEEERLLPVQ